MRKISDSIQNIIKSQSFFVFGLSNKLLNLSQLSRFIQPLVKAQTKKNVETSAILMSLSRLQKKYIKKNIKKEDFQISNLTVHYNLCSLTFLKTKEIVENINKFYINLQDKSEYITISQGTREITIIISENLFKNFKKIVSEKPIQIKKNVASIGVQFGPNYVERPGMIYYLVQHITLQNINIEEISSTFTELIFYIDKKDMKLAFDTLSGLLAK